MNKIISTLALVSISAFVFPLNASAENITYNFDQVDVKYAAEFTAQPHNVDSNNWIAQIAGGTDKPITVLYGVVDLKKGGETQFSEEFIRVSGEGGSERFLVNSGTRVDNYRGTTNITPSEDQIFQEVASQFSLTSSQLAFFEIFGQDKVIYSLGSGLNFAYKSGGNWYLAGDRRNIQDVGDCSEYSNVPEQYRPFCYDAVTGQNKYADSQGQSLNYPLSQRTYYIHLNEMDLKSFFWSAKKLVDNNVVKDFTPPVKSISLHRFLSESQEIDGIALTFSNDGQTASNEFWTSTTVTAETPNVYQAFLTSLRQSGTITATSAQ
jgi:hypothetical protein